MPVGSSRRGSHDHATRVRYPRLRLFDGHADIAGAHHSRMMRTAPVGGVGANPISLSAQCGKGSHILRVTAFLVSRPTGCGNGLGGAWEFSPCDPCHASCCSMRVHRKHECKDSTRVAGSIVDCAGISLRIACACFRGPTGRGDALRTHSVRVRIPAKAPAETRASTPPIQVLNAYLFWERYVGRTFHN